MARRVKSLQNNRKGISPNHREHRSKKNRRKIGKDQLWLNKQRKLEKYKRQIEHFDEEIKRTKVA